MNLQFVTPILAGMLTFLICGLASRFFRLRRGRTAIARPPAPPTDTEVLQSIRSSLHEISQEFESSPLPERRAQNVSKILLLSGCGIPSSEIARHLQMSRDEVELRIQVDRQRTQRATQEQHFV